MPPSKRSASLATTGRRSTASSEWQASRGRAALRRASARNYNRPVGTNSRFRDLTASWWPPAANVGEDDNVVAFLDADDDGDADFVIGSLSGPDRLIVNDGRGRKRWISVSHAASRPCASP